MKKEVSRFIAQDPFLYSSRWKRRTSDGSCSESFYRTHAAGSAGRAGVLNLMTSSNAAMDYAPNRLSEWLVGSAVVAVSAVAAWLGSFPVMSTARAHADIYRQLELGMPQEEALQIADALGNRRPLPGPDTDPGQPAPWGYAYGFYKPLHGGTLRIRFSDGRLVSKEVVDPDSIKSDAQVLNPRYGGALRLIDFLFFGVPLATLACAVGVFKKIRALHLAKRYGLAGGGLVFWALLVCPYSAFAGLLAHWLN